MHRFIGYDPDGVARVFADHPNVDVAETWCEEEVFRWRMKRRDMRPLSSWIVCKAPADSQVSGPSHGDT